MNIPTINSKILLSAASIAAAGSLVVGATFAFFSDSATSNDNTFATGTADLQIANDVGQGDPDVYGDSITGVSVSGMAPGDTTTKDFWLKNNSDGDFSMDVTADLANLGGSDNGTLPNVLLVQFTCDTDKDGLGTGDSSTSNKSVSNWITDTPESLGTIGPNDGPKNATTASDQDELLCRMTANLPSETGDSVAGKDLSFDGIFDGTQVAGP